MDVHIPLPQGLSLKIGDTLPRGKDYATAGLQKGFLLLDGDRELAEEGVGFGVPVLKRGLQTIFPGAVTLTSNRTGSTWEISAAFELNLVEKIARNGNEHVENGLLYAVKNILAGAIRQLPFLRAVLTGLSGLLRRVFKWETTYAPAGFSSQVTVFHSVDGETGKVMVEVVTGDLPPGITEVIVMNEQGAHHFDQYSDSSGLVLRGAEIGCWDEVKAGAARFGSSDHRVVFSLDQAQGARLYRGRELVGNRLAWAGFGYSFPPSINNLRYEMRIEKPA